MWGGLAKVNIPINKKRKIGPKIVDCVFVGYSLNNTNYKFLVVDSGVSVISNLSFCNNVNKDIVFELNFVYILLVVDYVSKWVEAKPTRANDAKVVVDFVIFSL